MVVVGYPVGKTNSRIIESFQRKSFYASGRFWVFYSDGTNMVYCSSVDGINWTSPTTVRPCTLSNMFSVWFDGTYVHYAYANASSIYYRRGTPNADGTIAWSTDTEQTVPTKYNTADYPMISVDSYGYVWVGYRDYDSSTFNYYPYVIKSGNKDGTWGTTPTGFPYQLSTTAYGTGCRVSIIPLTGGKMLAIYSYGGVTVKAKAWNGSAWGTEVATASAIYDGSYHSAVAQGDDVHLVFLKYSPNDITYTKYMYSANSFGAETILKAATAYSPAPVLTIDKSNNLHVFWAGYPTSNHIFYIEYYALTGTWGILVDWLSETALSSNTALTSFYMDYGGQIGLVYTAGSTIPYDVKFALISLVPLYVTHASISDLQKGFSEDNVYSGKAYSQYDNVIKAADASRAFEVSLLDAWNNGTSDTTIGFRFGAGTIRFQKKLSPDSGFIINLIKAKWRGPTNTPFNIYSYDPTPRISFTVTGELV
jgi:hypothetical protein